MTPASNPWRIGPVSMPPPRAEAMPDNIVVNVDGQDVSPAYDPKTGSSRTEIADGGVVINFSRIPKKGADAKAKHEANLVDEIDDLELMRIANELVQGIETDIAGVAERLSDLAEGVKMLGFKLEAPRGEATSPGAATEGMSRVYHPILGEACLRFQANSRGELLPAEGPVKIEADGTDQGDEGDDLAEMLEEAMNRFFTTTAKEYYPDTIRMLFDVGFSGSGFKKCFHCPIRRRPVSQSIAAQHFVVSNAATDLMTCGRKTHIIPMEASTFRRMQILGVYRDIDLSDPIGTNSNQVDLAKNEATGINPNAAQPEDRPRTLYETYAEIDIRGFEDKDKKGEITGLRLPYRVTIDKDSKQVLQVCRNWDKKDPMKLEKRVFVKYPYVNAMDFYGIGLFHILGNIARALTAGWRLSLDNGMLANFPAGLIDSRAARQLTNEFRLSAGSMAKIDVPSGMSIKDVVGGLPYRDVSAPFVALLEQIAQEGQKTGGTAELSIGEGRQDAPVGTTLALLEQATKTSDAVHKGLHSAQAEEFQIMKELFREDPESLWRHEPNETETWDKQKIVTALQRCDIVPRADPNTPSQMHRLMKVQSLVGLAEKAPQLFGQRGLAEVAKIAIETMGFEDAMRFIQPDPSTGLPDPKTLLAQAAVKDSETKAATLQLNARTFDAKMKNDADERQEDLQLGMTKLETEKIIHSSKIQADALTQQRAHQHEKDLKGLDVRADLAKAALGHSSDHLMKAHDHAHEGTLAAFAAAQTPSE